MNHKLVYRLYVEESLQIRNIEQDRRASGAAQARTGPKRKVTAKLREDRKPATAPNQVWAMDFLSDPLFDGPKIRILPIVDAFSKGPPAIGVRQRYHGKDVVDTLEQVTSVYGLPKTIRVDNGPEFISKDLDLWAWSKGVTLDFSRPGRPTDNAFVESFNGKVRAECIDQHWLLTLDDARSKCETYRREYNEERPHSAIGNKTPMAFMKAIRQPSRPMA